MKYRCLIIDDEELARELIETHLKQIDDFELVASCANAIEASKILQTESVDLLFLDIEMPVLKGTDFFKNLINKPKVIFTTAYRDYAIEGFELNAVDYLLKPIVFNRFFKAIQKFRQLHKNSAPTIEPNHSSSDKKNNHIDYIFIRKNRKQVKLNLAEVLYIESLKDYIKIHIQEDNHVIKQGISSFEKELDNRFVRIHRSFIVNITKVTAYTKHDVEIGSKEIPIGDNYKKILNEIIKTER